MQQQQKREPPILITVEDAAKRLCIGRTAAYELVRRNLLKSVKIGRTRRVVADSIQEYIQQLLGE